MSDSGSPVHFVGETDHFYDPNFTAEISNKMRVPKRINVDGVSDMPVVNRPESHWMPAEKLEMIVPEKIIVADDNRLEILNGDDSLFGTRAIPREISLDNKVMPPDPGYVRVQTPPRVLTIDSANYFSDFPPAPTYKHYSNQAVPETDRRLEISTSSNSFLNESGPIEGMPLNEEMIHLRQQLAKLNRRVMLIELDLAQRQNRDKIVYALGLAYLFFKTVLWLSRS